MGTLALFTFNLYIESAKNPADPISRGILRPQENHLISHFNSSSLLTCNSPVPAAKISVASASDPRPLVAQNSHRTFSLRNRYSTCSNHTPKSTPPSPFLCISHSHLCKRFQANCNQSLPVPNTEPAPYAGTNVVTKCPFPKVSVCPPTKPSLLVSLAFMWVKSQVLHQELAIRLASLARTCRCTLASQFTPNPFRPRCCMYCWG